MRYLIPALITIITLSAASAERLNGQARPTTVAQGSAPEICTQLYQPVCGTDPSGKRMTYSNACFARLAKATNITAGDCPK